MKNTLNVPQPLLLLRMNFWGWPGLALVPVGLLLVSGCGKHDTRHATTAPELSAVQVRTQAVTDQKLKAVEEVVGTVRAKLRATIEAKASGRIAEMPILLGQRLKTGQLVARLDAPEIKARLEQAEAAMQQAERDWKRAAKLFTEQAATRSDADAAESRYLVAKGAVAEARAMLSYIEILTPFDGVVTKKWADVGDLAAPGKPLMDIEDPSRLQLEADVPEAVASDIKPEAQLALRVGQTSAEVVARVTEIAPIADPASRTFRVKLDLPSLPGVMSGQFARLLVPVGETTSLRVPASAVVQRGQMDIVFAVENQRARLHLVKTGRRVKDELEILAGLDSGDLVVVENANLLVDGQPVETK